jgi:plasmid stabilization system protein ParE
VTPVVRFEDEADAEYREAGRWYDVRQPGLGLQFFDEVDAAICRIVDLPRLGARVPRTPRDLPVRRLAGHRFPYHVIYVEPPGELRILAIAHDRRKPGYWRTRLS